MGVLLGVNVAVEVSVGVGVLLGVNVTVGVSVGVGVLVGVAVGVGVLSGMTVMVTVATFELSMPSLAWYVKLVVPLKPGSGTKRNEPSALKFSEPSNEAKSSTAVSGSPSASLSFASSPTATGTISSRFS